MRGRVSLREAFFGMGVRVRRECSGSSFFKVTGLGFLDWAPYLKQGLLPFVPPPCFDGIAWRLVARSLNSC